MAAKREMKESDEKAAHGGMLKEHNENAERKKKDNPRHQPIPPRTEEFIRRE